MVNHFVLQILQELQVIKQGQTDTKKSQNKILEWVGAVESELNKLKTEVEGVKVNQANVNAKVNLFEKSVCVLNFEINIQGKAQFGFEVF